MPHSISSEVRDEVNNIKTLLEDVKKDELAKATLKKEADNAVIQQGGVDSQSAQIIAADAFDVVQDSYNVSIDVFNAVAGLAKIGFTTILPLPFGLTKKLLKAFDLVEGAAKKASNVFGKLASILREIPTAAQDLDAEFPSVGNELLSIDNEISSISGDFQSSIEAEVQSVLTSLQTPPIAVIVPSTQAVVAGQTIAITGLSVSDPSALGTNVKMVVDVVATGGTISMRDINNHLVQGSDTTGIEIVGSIETIDFELATLSYAANTTATTGVSDNGISVLFTDQADQDAKGYFEINIKSPPVPPTPPTPPSTSNLGEIQVAWGDVHLVDGDGLLYNFQAVGEFVLTESTLAGDSYQIQIRLQPYGSSTSVSVMTQIGAAVGSDRVTFGIGRANTVWIDGTPSTISATNPTVALNGGTLTELSSDQFKLAWNTGETLIVTDYGAYFGISTQLTSSEGVGSVKGLLGSESGTANDFQLADGTVISQPLTSAELYGEFANAWRVMQATSLLDYGTGQTTATFTDLNFPYQPASLSDFSASAVAQAAQMVAAAGITDPNVGAAAELDYLETNDASFITGAAAASQSQPDTTLAVITPTPDPGVTAPAAETVGAGATIPITGLSLSDPSAIGSADALTLTLSATAGTISMTDAGTAIAGSGTGTIDISGSLEQLNADLGTLSYTAGSKVGSASIAVDVVDQAGIAATGSIGVTVNGVVFSDNFNSYPYQTDWVPPADWTAPGPGTVDLIGQTTSGTGENLYPGNGGYVDLDGTNGLPGTLQTIASFAAGTYTLTFDLGGNALGDVDKTTVVTLGNWSTSITLPSGSTLQPYSYTFDTTGGKLSFQDLTGGNQDIGNILDNVALSSTSSTTPPVAATSLNGEQVSLDAYYPNITPSDLIGAGTATVTPGTTTFPSFAALGVNGGRLTDGSLTIGGDSMTFLYPAAAEGTTFASGAQNTYVLTELTPAPGSLVGDITGASLAGTNISGLTASDLSFTPDSVSLNVAGLMLPHSVQGSIQIALSFANQ